MTHVKYHIFNSKLSPLKCSLSSVGRIIARNPHLTPINRYDCIKKRLTFKNWHVTFKDICLSFYSTVFRFNKAIDICGILNLNVAIILLYIQKELCNLKGFLSSNHIRIYTFFYFDHKAINLKDIKIIYIVILTFVEREIEKLFITNFVLIQWLF